MAKNGYKWLKIVKNPQKKGKNGLKWLKIAKTAKNG